MSLMDNRVFAGLRLLRDVPDVPGAQSIVDSGPESSVWLTNCRCVSIAKVRGILPADVKLDRESLPKVKMPNRNGFIPDPVCRLYNESKLPFASCCQ